MDNLSGPERQSRDDDTTQQIWSAQGSRPAGRPGPGQDAARPDAAAMQAHLAKDRHRARRWTIGLTAAVALAVGGVFAGLSLAGNSAPAASQAAASGPAGQAALLNATLNAADSPGPIPASATPGTACARAPRAASQAQQGRLSQAGRRSGAMAAARCRPLRRGLARFLLLNGVDGQFSFQTRQGIKTLAYERGVIQSVSPGASVVVKGADGTSWTWDLTSSTVVRDRSGKLAGTTLTAGQQVWVGGPVVQGSKNARLIFLNPPTRGSIGTPVSPPPAPSGGVPTAASGS